jgi:hypothetical protein
MVAGGASFADRDLGYLRPRSAAPINFMPRMSTELASLRVLDQLSSPLRIRAVASKDSNYDQCGTSTSTAFLMLCRLSLPSMASFERAAFLNRKH